MRRQTRRSSFAVLLCVFLLAFTLLSTMLAAAHTHHHGDCLDDQCVVCAVIHSARQFQRQVLLLLGMTLLALVALLSSFSQGRTAARSRKVATPVSLKIRLNP